MAKGRAGTAQSHPDKASAEYCETYAKQIEQIIAQMETQTLGLCETEGGAPVFSLRQKVRNRHLSEYGIIICVARKESGYWYEVTTPKGMHIGWWHETDIDDAPRTSPPETSRA